VRWWVGTGRFCGRFILFKIMTPSISPHLTPPRLRTGESMHLVRFWPSPTSRARRERQRGGVGSAVVGGNRPVLCAGGVTFLIPCKMTVFPLSQEKVVVSGRSCLPFRNHTFLEGEVALAFISESCHPVIPAQW
jgi:hypothetical protein